MIEVADLVSVPMSKDIGIVLRIIEHSIRSYDFQQETSLLAEVYWQNMGRSRLEIVSDLKKLN